MGVKERLQSTYDRLCKVRKRVPVADGHPPYFVTVK